MGTSNWDKFSLLMWKNWKLQWNHKIQLAIEIFLPAIFSLLLVLIRTLVDPNDISTPTVWEEVNITLHPTNSLNPSSPVKIWELAYSPKNPCIDEIVKNASNWLTLHHNLNNKNQTIGYVGLENATQLEKYLIKSQSLAGIQFDDKLSESKDCPKMMSYSIRFPSELRSTDIDFQQSWLTNIFFPIFDFGGPRNKDMPDGGNPPGYMQEGFIAVQHAMGQAIINILGVKNNKPIQIPDVVMRRVPYPPYIDDVLLQGLEAFVSLIILLSFVYPSSQTVKYITTEKEKQLKEVMKIMGLPNWLHWTAWFVKSFLLMAVAVTFIVILLKINWQSGTGVAVLTHANLSALLFFLYLYCIATVTFCFMLATFFSKATTAAAVSGLVWFICYIPYQFTVNNYASLSLLQKLGISIFSNSAMGYGFKLILKLEGTGEGLQWDNMFRPVNIDDNLSVGLLEVMMIVCSIIHMLVTLYIEKIFPGEYGVPEKWYFPFTKEFWSCGSNNDGAVEDISKIQTIRMDQNAFEADPKNKHVGLAIRNLRKQFGDKIAVNNLTMNLHEDEITVLLGHNGAGKTTTMSMLTGMFPPTSGTAVVNGSDIRTNLMGARMSLGFCPQHNILFDELTVRDHIVFYSRLKGLEKKDIDREVDKYVKVLQLEPKINTQSMKLSGGMKRKLSIGAALCGGSKVVLCDEPSSGMDPAARRSLWDLLQAEKKGRTVLLSTHFMDEADVLGDRIAIMCGGELKAYGTSFFLKKQFGVGYHLICVKKEGCNPLHITNLLRQYIPDISVESDIGTELSYQLPDKYSKFFEKMLGELEDQSESLDLNGYGVSITSLEEVFMQVGAEKQDPYQNGTTMNGNGTHIEDVESFELDNDRIGDSIHLLSGMQLVKSQWEAMFLKKFLYSIRNIVIMFVQNFMPIFFIVITVLISKTADRYKTLQALNITIESYGETVTILETVQTATSIEQKISEEYKSYYKSFSAAHSLKPIDQDFMEYIVDLGKKMLVRVNSQYLIAATIEKNKITAWFNNQLLHVAPLTLNTVHNAMLRASVDPSYSIRVTNFPLPYSTNTRLASLGTGNNLGFQLSLNLSFCMSFVSAFYILFLIKERESRAKLLQFVSGVRVLIFWFSQFIGDYITYLITALITIITLACFQEDGFSTFGELGRVFLVLLLFGVGVLPLTYLFSMLFKDSATGFSRLSILNIFTGMALFVVVFVMAAPVFDLADTAKILNYIFLLFPHYSFAKSLSSINTVGATEKFCTKACEYFNIPSVNCNMELLCKIEKRCCVTSYYAWEEPGIGANILFTGLGCLAFFTILLIKEFRLIDELVFKAKLAIMPPPISHTFEDPQIDEDVKNEKNRISRMSSSEVKNTNLVLDQVTKYYSKFMAVNQVSVGINHSECFGLLGVNGAGKTTTFKMMTGDERITYGEAYIKGIDIKNNMNEVYREIGYCPQFDALLEDLTGREVLRIFCLLRGIPEKRINSISNEMAKAFGYTKHIDKRVKAYSGGNKRKLSTSIALLGSPSVIYLDEPTTGMDPGARRQLWNMVCKVRDSGKSIVLTSHSMEECEALCTKLAIMVNGEFKCIGSTQHLKNKFSKGLVLKLKLKRNESAVQKKSSIQNDITVMQGIDEDVAKVKQFVENEFHEAVLQEQYQGILTFYIPLTSIRWSKIFGLMEKNKESLNIEDYSISQTTLEQIFLEFAKCQREDTRLNQ